jgi:hypothetical protein
VLPQNSSWREGKESKNLVALQTLICSLDPFNQLSTRAFSFAIILLFHHKCHSPGCKGGISGFIQKTEATGEPALTVIIISVRKQKKRFNLFSVNQKVIEFFALS